ncbi:MAG: hypothetical protein IIA61_01800 [Candidatus Marinimicrobia bacterium]|nr:hypothetical protein [Candidatus Neomarinimicrobiota bacterium]
MIRTITIIIIFIFVLFPSHAIAQESFVWVAGMEMKIGMKKNEILSKIKNNYRVSKFAPGDAWLIYQKDDKANEAIGQVAFQNDKLVWASSYWGSFSGEATEFSKALYGLFTNLLNSGQRIIKISTESKQSPGISVSSIEFKFQDKVVSIDIWQGKKTKNEVSIQESFHHLKEN